MPVCLILATWMAAAPPTVPSPATKPADSPPTKTAPSDVVPVAPSGVKGETVPLSDAEKVARATRLIETGKKDLQALEAELNDPESEYARAEKEFQELDSKLTSLKADIDKLRAGKHLEEAAKKETELTTLQTDWSTARDRFDLAIRQRKTVLEKIDALKSQIERGQAWLKRLEGHANPEDAKPTTNQTVPPASPTNAPPPMPPIHATSPTTPATGTPATATPSTPPQTAPPIAPIPGLIPTPATTTPTAQAPRVEDAEVQRIRELAQKRQAELKEAEANAKTAEERVRTIQKHIDIENRLLEVERETAKQAGIVLSKLTQTLAVEAPEDPAERAKLEDRLADANRRLTVANEKIKQITDRLGLLNESLQSVQQLRIQTLQETERKRQEATAAAEDLTEILNPFDPRNIQKWFQNRGPSLLLIICAMIVIYIIFRSTSRRVVSIFANHHNRGSETDRDNRVNTLVGVFRSISTMAIFGGGGLIFLDQAGVPVVPLMGGAAVIGLAVAFGAQNLIKDYFTGFMILMEDQYSVNDVVRIGSISGQVEKLTPRVTVLRDAEGTLHFIPHGTITNVSNLTHTWSRAVFDIPIPYDADLEQAMHSLMEVAQGMRSDPGFGGDIIEDPEMLGVDAYSEAGVIVRFVMKTRPLRQWAVKREMLRRIKLRLDQIGIGIPSPRRAVYHRFPEGVPAAVPSLPPIAEAGFEPYRRSG